MPTKLVEAMMLGPMPPSKKLPGLDALVCEGRELVGFGMPAVVHSGCMGDRSCVAKTASRGVVALVVLAGLPVGNGSGTVNAQAAASLTMRAVEAGAAGPNEMPPFLARAV